MSRAERRWGLLARKVLIVFKFDNKKNAIDMMAYLDFCLTLSPRERPDEEVDEPHHELDILDEWRETDSLLNWIKTYRKKRLLLN